MDVPDVENLIRLRTADWRQAVFHRRTVPAGYNLEAAELKAHEL